MSDAATQTLSKVASEFEAEVLQDLEEGREQAVGKVESAKKETAEAVAKILQTGAKQAESLKRQMIGSAELEVRNGQLRSVEKAVTDVFDSSMKKASSTSGSKYERALTGLMKEGIEVIGLKASVLCSSRDRKAATSVARKLSTGRVKLSVSDERIETSGGVILTSPDGTVRFDNTFEARLERMKPELRKEIAAILGGS